MISCFHLTVPHPHRQRPLLDDATLKIDKGAFAEIVGPSGAGKSVLCSLLGLRRRCASAKCIIAGRNLDRLDHAGLADLRRKIGSCAQQPSFLEERSVLENLLLPFVARQAADDALGRVEALIADTPVEALAEVPARGLSGAERRLVGIFRALVGQPELVIIDGGLAGLDDLRGVGADAVRAAYDAGATMVLSGRQTSQFDDLRTMTIRVDDGHLVVGDGAQPSSDDPAAIDGAA